MADFEGDVLELDCRLCMMVIFSMDPIASGWDLRIRIGQKKGRGSSDLEDRVFFSSSWSLNFYFILYFPSN